MTNPAMGLAEGDGRSDESRNGPCRRRSGERGNAAAQGCVRKTEAPEVEEDE